MPSYRWAVLDAAHSALRTTIAGVPADRWHEPTPCEHWDVAEVVQHVTGIQLAYAAKATGGLHRRTHEEASSSLAHGHATELIEAALAAAAEAFATVSPSHRRVAVPLPPYSLPGARAVEAAALAAAIHAWDIAVSTGQPSPLTPELATGLRPAAYEFVEYARGRAYGDPIEPHAGDDPATSLLGYLGRRAEWSTVSGSAKTSCR